jgi:hypothetical protein
LWRNIFLATSRPRHFLDDGYIFEVRHATHCTAKRPTRRIWPIPAIWGRVGPFSMNPAEALGHQAGESQCNENQGSK